MERVDSSENTTTRKLKFFVAKVHSQKRAQRERNSILKKSILTYLPFCST